MPGSGDIVEFLEEYSRRRVNRRSALRCAGAAASGLFAARGLAASPPYSVGVGSGSDPYATTLRAIDASGEWPAPNLSGKVVVIKPNLVGRALPQTGTVTDPQVVRAVVDRAFASGAVYVIMIEAGPHGANFDFCGYGFFRTYDPGGRIQLVDLGSLPTALQPLNGWIYNAIHTHPLVLNRSYFYIGVSKMKTHAEAFVTLGTKNNFGLPALDSYVSTPAGGRFAMHDRGLNQAIVDNYLLRPPDFNVMDGIVAMEGEGPWAGTPVAMNTVLAARNTLAMDRIALYLMKIPQNAVRYLNYMSLLKLGPADLTGIAGRGDSVTPRAFVLPKVIPPSFEPASLAVATFSPGTGQSCTMRIAFHETCDRQVQVLSVSDNTNTSQLIRELIPLATKTAGNDDITWDGRMDNGALAAPGRYAVHVRALRLDRATRSADATTWVTVK